MIQTCTNCKNYDISISDEPCRECQKAFRRGEGKPNFIASITNADRIRSMTDEELAEWFSIYCCRNKTYDAHCDEFGNCKACWLDWLREEVESNDS